MKTTARKIIEERGFRLELVKIEGGGKIFYHYLLILESKYEALKKACEKKEIIKLENLGKILLSGEGEVPSDFHREVIKIFLKEIEGKV